MVCWASDKLEGELSTSAKLLGSLDKRGIKDWVHIEGILRQNLNQLCDKKLEVIFKCEMRSLQK